MVDVTHGSDAVVLRVGTDEQGSHPINVEITDELAPEGEGVERHFRAVEFLSNGWLRCIDPSYDSTEDDVQSVDYFPPLRVIGVFSVEGADTDDGGAA